MTSDVADLTAARAGDQDAFARLYDRHAGLVLSFCRRGAGWPDAEDALQETFVRALRRLDQVRDGERVGAWLCAIARNVCSERRRSRVRRARHEAAAAGNGDAHLLASGGERGAPDEETQRLTAALDRLPERERLAIHLYYMGSDPPRAASTMRMTRSGFHKLLERARCQLAVLLREASVHG